MEIQALWIRLLRQLERLRAAPFDEPWGALADRATSFLGHYWHEDLGFFGDTLHAPSGTPASRAVPDDHLRPNQLFAISLGLMTMYVLLFRQGQSAVSAILFLILLGLTVLAFRTLHRKVHYA